MPRRARRRLRSPASARSPRDGAVQRLFGCPKSRLDIIALCAIVYSVRVWRAHLQNQMDGAVCAPERIADSSLREAVECAGHGSIDGRSWRRRHQPAGRPWWAGPLRQLPHADRLQGRHPRHVPLRVRQKRAREHHPDELLTLREIGAGWLARTRSGLRTPLKKGICRR
jgi:hypothetical protein